MPMARKTRKTRKPGGDARRHPPGRPAVGEGAGHLRLMHDVALIANEATSAPVALAAAIRRVCEEFDWPVGHVFNVRWQDGRAAIEDAGIWRLADAKRYAALVGATRGAKFRPGVGLVGRAVKAGRLQWIADVRADRRFVRGRGAGGARRLGVRMALAVPVSFRDRVEAVLEFFAAQTLEPDEQMIELMASVGTSLGRVIERQRLGQELIDAVWSRQRYLGQELHDNLGQMVTGVSMMARSLHSKLQQRGLAEAEDAEMIAGTLQKVRQEVRRMARGMLPVLIDAHGLMSALEELCATAEGLYGIACDFHCEQPVAVEDNNTATHLYRIAQEAISNAVNHGRAGHVAVSLETVGGQLRLRVQDDGSGLPAELDAGGPGMGLRIMQYRAEVIGGDFRIDASPHGGAVVTCTLREER
ncbi:MAG: hypothetical protein BIFFINMI_01561 [Phycisphaerae bacterium]|nr:hypothetical protein [Phycisphaerae bacterium]